MATLARLLQKKQHAMRCAGFSGMLLSFVKTLKDDTKDSSMRCVGFSGMPLSFVTTLRFLKTKNISDRLID
jgi:hypothetical protein